MSASDANSRRNGALLTYAALLVKHGTALLVTPLLIRRLGTGQYGLYALIGSVAGVLLLLDMGLTGSGVRFISKFRVDHDRAEEEAFYSTAFFLYIFVSSALCVICALLARWLPVFYAAAFSPEDLALLRALCGVTMAHVLFTLWGGAFQAVLTAYEKFAFIKIVDIAGFSIRFILLLACLLLGRDVLFVLLADACAGFAANAVKAVYAVRAAAIRIRFRQIALHHVRRVLGYSRYIFLATLAGQIYWKIDCFILGRMGNSLWIAISSVGTQLTLLFIALSSAIVDVFFPKIVGLVARDATREELTGEMIRVGRLQAVVIAPLLIGFILFGRKFVILWAGEACAQAYWITLAVMLPLSALLVQNLGIYILQAMNRHRFRSVVMLGMAVFNVGLTVAFVRLWGVVGAGVSTGAGLLLGNVVALNVYYSRVIGLHMGRFFRELLRGIGPALVLAAAAGAGLALWLPAVSWPALAAQAAGYAPACAAFMGLFGLNPAERKLVRDILVLFAGRKPHGRRRREMEAGQTVEDAVGRNRCVGCSACRHVCPARCIEMAADGEGFSYPRVDRERCVRCGACVRACPALRELPENPFGVWAGWHRLGTVRTASSSGGAFTALAWAALSQGGCVAGAVLDRRMRCRHMLAEGEEGLALMRGSKYVQSDLGDIFPQVKYHLDNGRAVLFTGTPCQVAGLYGYLGRDHPSLCTADLVCHGVPSQKVFLSYIGSLEKAAGRKIVSYRFRDGRQGWRAPVVCATFADGSQKAVSYRDDSFFRGFSRNLFLRPSCYRCGLRGGHSRADLTLGDFWGIERAAPLLDSDQGVSLILCHTEKGAAWLRRADAWLALVPRTPAEASACNPPLVSPPPLPRNRAKFFRVYLARGYDAARRRFLLPPPEWLRRLRDLVRRVLDIPRGRRREHV